MATQTIEQLKAQMQALQADINKQENDKRKVFLETTASWSKEQKQKRIDNCYNILKHADLDYKESVKIARVKRQDDKARAKWELETLGAMQRGLGKVKRNYTIEGKTLKLYRPGVFDNIATYDLSKVSEKEVIEKIEGAFLKAGFSKTDGVVRSDVYTIKNLIRSA